MQRSMPWIRIGARVRLKATGTEHLVTGVLELEPGRYKYVLTSDGPARLWVEQGEIEAVDNDDEG